MKIMYLLVVIVVCGLTKMQAMDVPEKQEITVIDQISEHLKRESQVIKYLEVLSSQPQLDNQEAQKYIQTFQELHAWRDKLIAAHDDEYNEVFNRLKPQLPPSPETGSPISSSSSLSSSSPSPDDSLTTVLSRSRSGSLVRTLSKKFLRQSSGKSSDG